MKYKRLDVTMGGTIPRPPVHRITLYQVGIALLISAILTAIGTVVAYSFLSGSLIHIAGTAYFARQAFKYQGARNAPAIVRQMYLGESGKIFLSVALFAMVFALIKPLSAVNVFAGYIVQVIAHPILATMLTHPKH